MEAVKAVDASAEARLDYWRLTLNDLADLVEEGGISQY